MVFVVSFNLEIYPDREAQIAFLLIEEVKILEKYSDFTNIFSEEKALVLPEHIKLNEYTIDLEDDKQLSYRPIYSLGLVELETLKTYNKTHLKTEFIQLFKSLAGTSILFDKKPDSSLCLCIDYQGLNNFTIKNQYFLLLIREPLD